MKSWLNGQTYIEQKMNEHMHRPLLKKHERFWMHEPKDGPTMVRAGHNMN
jgi:hypothetical protein